MSRQKTRREFGAIRKLPSNKYQASYLDPRGTGKRINAPMTFPLKGSAEHWLAGEQLAIATNTWEPPTARPEGGPATVESYGRDWLVEHEMQDSTRYQYAVKLETLVFPHIGEEPLKTLSKAAIRKWHKDRKADGTPRRSREIAYTALRSMLSSAVEDDLLSTNPCTLKKVIKSTPDREAIALEIDEVHRLAIAVPSRYRAMILIAGLCGLRWGEVTALRRGDVDVARLELKVRTAMKLRRTLPSNAADEARHPRATAAPQETFERGTPKTEASKRIIDIPPHVGAAIAGHLANHVGPEPDALLFPSVRDPKHPLNESTFHRWFKRGLTRSGLPVEFHFHDLRHTSATLLAGTGQATIADVMKVLGHTTPRVAVRYQHPQKTRSQAMARTLTEQAKAAGF